MNPHLLFAVGSFFGPSTFWSGNLFGLGLPLLVSALLCASGATGRLSKLLLLILIAGTTISLALQRWQFKPGDVIELHIVPACALAVIFLPRQFRPSWQLAYCLVFFSTFATDAICAIQFSAQHHYYLPDLLRGIGGAGLGDGLFLYPFITAIGLQVLRAGERASFGQIDIFRFARSLVGL